MAKYTAAGAGLGLVGCLILVAFVLASMALFPFLLMVGWNLVIPAFGGPALTFVQAIGLYIVLAVVGGTFRSVTAKVKA